MKYRTREHITHIHIYIQREGEIVLWPDVACSIICGVTLNVVDSLSHKMNDAHAVTP